MHPRIKILVACHKADPNIVLFRAESVAEPRAVDEQIHAHSSGQGIAPRT